MFPWIKSYRGRVGAGTPAYGAEVHRQTITADQTSDVLTLSTGIASGKMAVLAMASGAGSVISAVTDSKSNSWTVRQQVTDTFGTASLVTASISNALVASDTITVTVNSGFRNRVYSVNHVTASSYDVGNNATTYGTTVSISATATAPAVFIGVIAGDSNSGGYSWTGSSWTTIGSSATYGSTNRAYFTYYNAAASGAQNPGGAWSAAVTQYNAIVALK